MSPPIEVELLLRTARSDATLMERISELTNEVYAVAEAGLWADGATRTSVGEIAELTGAGQIAVARMGGQVVGCVRLQRLDDHTGEFGMLCADPAHRGMGIGRELIRFVERQSRADGVSTMQLELLQPREWTHPDEAVLGRVVLPHRLPDRSDRDHRRGLSGAGAAPGDAV